MADWKEYKLDEIADIVGGGTPKTEVFEYWNGNIAWITPRDLSGYSNRYISKGERSISISGLNNSNARLLPKGTVLLSSRAPIGYLAIAENEVTTNQGFQSLVPNEKVNNTFLYYLLKNNVDYLISQGEGTVFGELAKRTVKELVFTFPPLPKQQAIAEVLSSLDDKIDLLHRQNKTLEAMAETLFRQWFVEEAAESWEKKSLDQIANYLNGLALQKYPANGGETLPAIKIRELNQGITENTDKCSQEVPEQYIVQDGDILFSWSGSLQIAIWHDGEGALNQHLFKVTSENYPKWFYYLATKHHLEDFRAIAESKSTTMGHIQRHHLAEAFVFIPPKELFNQYNANLSPLIEKLVKNNAQIKTLTKQRDTLLPKLMSDDEVRVKF